MNEGESAVDPGTKLRVTSIGCWLVLGLYVFVYGAGAVGLVVAVAQAELGVAQVAFYVVPLLITTVLVRSTIVSLEIAGDSLRARTLFRRDEIVGSVSSTTCGGSWWSVAILAIPIRVGSRQLLFPLPADDPGTPGAVRRLLESHADE